MSKDEPLSARGASDAPTLTRRGALALGGTLAAAASAGYLYHRTTSQLEGVFVDPEGGDDELAGLSESEAVSSLRRATEIVTEMAGRDHVDIWLKDGVHHLTDTWVVAGLRTRTIWQAYPGHSPQVRGDQPLAGWVEARHGALRAWQTTVPEELARAGIRTLLVDGQRRPRPRLPAEVDALFEGGRATAAMLLPFGWSGDDRAEVTSFRHLGAIDPAWHDPTAVEIVSVREWWDERSPISRVDGERCWVRERPLGDVSWIGRQFYVENVREALAKPGQWYFDRITQRVTYLPLDGEELGETALSVPTLRTLLRVGKPGATTRGHEFRGIHFAGSSWHFMQRPVVDGKLWTMSLGACVQQGSVALASCSDITIANCTFDSVGEFAIDIAEACTGIVVQDCTITEAGAGGIKVASQAGKPGNGLLNTRGVRILHNEIERAGRVFHMAAGVIAQDVRDVEIRGNHIHHQFYSGVTTGWHLDYSRSEIGNVQVRANHIHDLGCGLLADLGGVYCMGVQPGSAVSENHIHHVVGAASPSVGIYLDRGASGIEVRQNLVHDCLEGVWAPNAVAGIQVRGNILASNMRYQIGDGGGERQLGLGGLAKYSTDIRDNVIVASGTQLAGPQSPSTVSDHNVWWDSTGAPDRRLPGGVRVFLQEVASQRVLAEAHVPSVNSQDDAVVYQELSEAVVLSPGTTYDLLLQAVVAGPRWRDQVAILTSGVQVLGSVFATRGEAATLSPRPAAFGPVNLRLRDGRELFGLTPATEQQRDDFGGRVGVRVRIGQEPLVVAALGVGAMPEANGWATWRAAGLDRTSIVMDPGISYQGNVLRVSNLQSIVAAGVDFTPFELPEAGPR